jgi:hypothetical protein
MTGDGQVEIDFAPLKFSEASGKRTIQECFEDFHRDNPWVYKAMVDLAYQEKRDGYRTSVKAMFEVLRYKYRRATVDKSSDFRLNNNYSSRYARMILESESSLGTVILTRELRAE